MMENTEKFLYLRIMSVKLSDKNIFLKLRQPHFNGRGKVP